MEHLDSRVQWVNDQLDKLGRGSKKALAEYIGIQPYSLSELLKGGRRIQLDEWPKIKEFFGSSPPDDELHPTEKPRGVRIMGMLGDDYWVVATKSPDDRIIGSPVTEFPVESQSAYEAGEPSVDGIIAKGDVLFTVPFSDYRTKPLAGDLLVIRRMKDDLANFSLQIVDAETGRLSPYLVGGKTTPNDEPIAVVIGRYSRWPR